MRETGHGRAETSSPQGSEPSPPPSPRSAGGKEADSSGPSLSKRAKSTRVIVRSAPDSAASRPEPPMRVSSALVIAGGRGTSGNSNRLSAMEGHMKALVKEMQGATACLRAMQEEDTSTDAARIAALEHSLAVAEEKVASNALKLEAAEKKTKSAQAGFSDANRRVYESKQSALKLAQ